MVLYCLCPRTWYVFTYSVVLWINLPSSVLRLPRRTRFPLSRSAAMHRIPCTRSQPLCKYLPSIASRRRTDTLTPFVYTNSITSKAKIMSRRQRGYRSHKHPFKCERLFIFLSYHPHREKSREKSNFYETKNIFSARKNLIYTGARLSYILCYNTCFTEKEVPNWYAPQKLDSFWRCIFLCQGKRDSTQSTRQSLSYLL